MVAPAELSRPSVHVNRVDLYGYTAVPCVRLSMFTPTGVERRMDLTPDEAVALATDLLVQARNAR
jgi:hypothetical protein